eukprot:4787320-Amphidinium_carterae.2
MGAANRYLLQHGAWQSLLRPQRSAPRVVTEGGSYQSSYSCCHHPSPQGGWSVGYPSTVVQCTVWAPALQDEVAEAPILRKHLVQLGFGPPVQLNTASPVTAQECVSTVKLTLSFTAAGGWRAEHVTAANVVAHLGKHIPEEDILEVTARADHTATVLAPESSAEALLRSSGIGHVYIKHTADDSMHVLWLATETDHAAALEAARDGTAFGLAHTMFAGRARYGIRYKTTEAYQAAARLYGLEETLFARWKASGIHPRVGVPGAHKMLEQAGWKVHEILYMDPSACVFDSTERGPHRIAQTHSDGTTSLIKVKAVNTMARDQLHSAQGEPAAVAHAKAAASTSSSRAAKQRAAAKALTASTPPPGAVSGNQGAVAPTTPRNTSAVRQREPADEHTGATPEAARQRTT